MIFLCLTVLKQMGDYELGDNFTIQYQDKDYKYQNCWFL